MGTASNELLGIKQRSSVLVRGFSAMEIAKQIEVIPSNYTEAQFIAYLREPAFSAASDLAAVFADVQTASEAARDDAQDARDAAEGYAAQALTAVGPVLASVGGLVWTTGTQLVALTGSGTATLRTLGAANGIASLDGAGKLTASQLPSSIVGAAKYQSAWNANTNSPAIPAAALANQGNYYIVSVAGTTSIDGISSWNVGDWIISNGTTWDKIDNTDSVTSVAGLAGIITGADLKTAMNFVKADVGLSNVDNYATASQAEAEAGVASNKFMTPERTKQAMDAAGTGLTLLATLTGPAATLEDTTHITAAYDNYLLVFENVLPVAVASLGAYVTSDGGANWNLASGIAGTSSGNVNETAGYGISGTFTLANVNATNNYKGLSGVGAGRLNGSNVLAFASDVYNGSMAAVNGIQIKFNGTSVASGSIKLYGLAK